MKKPTRDHVLRFALPALAALLVTLTATGMASAEDSSGYDEDSVVREAEAFFGEGAKGMADVISKAFKDHGQPNGFIKGEEAGGAIGVGLRYGHGTLQLKSGVTRKVYWQGPSVGFDVGGNAAKAFVLVYKLNDIEKLFQRFPGVDGSIYVVGGVGVNYNQSGDIVLAPIRLGVGWRLGASVGYMKVTKEKTINPF